MFFEPQGGQREWPVVSTTGEKDLTADTLNRAVFYTLGDDVISQTKAYDSGSGWTVGDTRYLLYDGHGSTRQLLNSDLSIQDSYSYDGYGVMLGDSANPQPAKTADTNLLYTGEMFDFTNQHYYNRARWYNPSNGLFNRTDPYAGNMLDPQSLHKYLYAHGNPVNRIDPTGEFSIVPILLILVIVVLLFMDHGHKKSCPLSLWSPDPNPQIHHGFMSEIRKRGSYRTALQIQKYHPLKLPRILKREGVPFIVEG